MITRIVYPVWGESAANQLRCSLYSFRNVGFPNSTIEVVMIQLGDVDKSKYDFLSEISNGWNVSWCDARSQVDLIPEFVQYRVTTDLWKKLAMWSLPESEGWTLYLDTDTIALRTCEALNEVEMFAAGENWGPNSYQNPYPFAGPYQTINTGLIIAKPTQIIWEGILNWCNTMLPDLPGIHGRGDECFINAMRPYKIMPPFILLHKLYNITSLYLKMLGNFRPIDPIVLHCTMDMWEDAWNNCCFSQWYDTARAAMIKSGLKPSTGVKRDRPRTIYSKATKIGFTAGHPSTDW